MASGKVWTKFLITFNNQLVFVAFQSPDLWNVCLTIVLLTASSSRVVYLCISIFLLAVSLIIDLHWLLVLLSEQLSLGLQSYHTLFYIVRCLELVILLYFIQVYQVKR